MIVMKVKIPETDNYDRRVTILALMNDEEVELVDIIKMIVSVQADNIVDLTELKVKYKQLSCIVNQLTEEAMAKKVMDDE